MKVNFQKYRKGPTERKLSVQVDRWDTYSLDHTLALIVLPLLLQLRQNMMGVPSDFTRSVGGDTDSNYCFDFIDLDKDEVFDKGCKQWEETLDKMIWSFQQLVMDDYDNKYHHGNMKIGWKPVEITDPTTGKLTKAYEMVDENPEEHWYDHVGHMLHEERIQEGLDLFAKYYRNLWD